MSRLIDADALEELFREVIGGIAKKPEMDGNLEHMVRASAMVIEMIQDAPTIEPEPHWIPCSEKIPKKTGYYICTCHDGACYRTSVLKWSTGWVLTGARSYWKVIAWMPLPEPWKRRGMITISRKE